MEFLLTLLLLFAILIPVIALSRSRRKLRERQRTPTEALPHRSVPVPARRPMVPPSDHNTKTVRNAAARWIGPEDDATVAGRRLGGMVYLGTETRRDTWQGGVAIDPYLPVAKVGALYAGEGMSYWPNYRAIDPRERATYLDWLAGGRDDPRIGPGYVFLFFYGIERRFFVDNPDPREKRLLLAEVERLLLAYGEHHSVRRYLDAFVEAARIVIDPSGDQEPCLGKPGYDLPLGLRVAIGRMARAGQPLSGDWLLAWYTAHRDTRHRTPAKRAPREFSAMFGLLFADRFPDGLKIRTPKRMLRARYAAASSAFELDLAPHLGAVPDIASLSKPLSVAREIADLAMSALEKYSRFLGRNPEGRDTIEAHALLPERLWTLFPSAEMESLRRWAEDLVDAGGLPAVEQVVERLEGTLPEKIGKRHLTGAADALARLSIGLAPDPRFALRGPRPGEPVVLFRLPTGVTALEDVSDRYRSVLLAIAMGSFVAHADGSVADTERAALDARIDAADLSAAEHARLRANLKWLFAVPPDLPLFRRRLADAPEDARHEFGHLALVMASADGAVDPKEIKAVERLYKAIGLPADGLYSDLHALAAGSEPVTVRPPGGRPREFEIPPPERDGRVRLDTDRIAALVADTARVSAVLGNIFEDDDPEEPYADDAEEEAGDRFPGLDPRHAALLDELLTRPRWEEPEFAALARQHRVMQAGALETLNEWSFDRFGDALIDEYEGYELNPDVAAGVTQGAA